MKNNKINLMNKMQYIDGITVVDTDGTILFSVKFYPKFNPEIENTEEIIGKNLFDVFTNLDSKSSTLIRAMNLKLPIFKEKQNVVDFRGSEIKTMNMSIPIMNNNVVIGAIEISKNINEYTYSNSVVKMNTDMFNDRKMITEHMRLDKARYFLTDIITNNHEMKQIKIFIEKIADSISPVLIYGETGTGKELFAHAIHNASKRAKHPFISQNCAAIPENLLESLLFGTTKGSFTGAYDCPGLFELAEGGSIFLDEIACMPINLQSKLLRVLQDGYVRRLGDVKERKINVRIISATNIHPQKCVQENKLRLDMYYRLSVLTIEIPPLRNRKEDIKLLLNFFINKYNNILMKNITNISNEAFAYLHENNWIGNVRELEHVVEYAMNIVDESDDTINMTHIKKMFTENNYVTTVSDANCIQPLKSRISVIEKEIIENALIKSEGNVSKAARKLEIPRQTLKRKIDSYEILNNKRPKTNK